MKIVTIGGGTGGSIVDEGVAVEFPDLISVVTSFDNGGSSGMIRKEFGTIPHGDIRRRIFAQKNLNNNILEDLYNFRFGKDNSLESHSLGNLMILAATKIWGEKEGIRKVCDLWQTKGKVLPITYDFADLSAKLSNGKTIVGEDLIGRHNIKEKREIEKVYLTRKTNINPEVKKEILTADYIILCPGDFYGSLVCNFLVGGFKEAIQKSKSKIIYFPNIMTKGAETYGFKLSNFVNTLEKYLGKKVDKIIYNSKKISSSNLRKYKQKEGAELVVNDLKDDKRVLQLPLVKENGHIRHDSKLVLNAFKKAIEPREKLFIFDLDDTLISTSPHVKEFLSRNFENLYLYKEAEKLIGQLSKGKCILLTYDENGLQKDKINLLNLKNFFSKIYIVKKVQEKHDVLQKLKDKYSDRDIIVVGDRHDAELASAKKLGLKTVCVALKENHNTDAKLHYLYDFVVETGEHFLELTKMV